MTADTHLTAGKNRVHFTSGGSEIVADLYLPVAYTAGAGVPAVVVEGPWTQVKEQVGGRYAAELAARGVAALALDHRGFGESGGEPRQVESPTSKVEDLRAAVTFLRSVPVIDPDRIGALGVCFGAKGSRLRQPRKRWFAWNPKARPPCWSGPTESWWGSLRLQIR